ncbi:hypothetical protein ACFL0Q_01830 [Thermodesulfobacteriota bacterium]
MFLALGWKQWRWPKTSSCPPNFPKNLANPIQVLLAAYSISSSERLQELHLSPLATSFPVLLAVIGLLYFREQFGQLFLHFHLQYLLKPLLPELLFYRKKKTVTDAKDLSLLDPLLRFSRSLDTSCTNHRQPPGLIRSRHRSSCRWFSTSISSPSMIFPRPSICSASGGIFSATPQRYLFTLLDFPQYFVDRIGKVYRIRCGFFVTLFQVLSEYCCAAVFCQDLLEFDLGLPHLVLLCQNVKLIHEKQILAMDPIDGTT